MDKQISVTKPSYCNLPADIEGFDSLAELALDLHWSWNHATDEVWRQLDPALWEFTQNPWVVLQTVSKDKLKSVLADSTFRKSIDGLLQAKRQAAEAPAWFQKNHPQSPLKYVAYFSMEYMLSEALPIYSGGHRADGRRAQHGWSQLRRAALHRWCASQTCQRHLSIGYGRRPRR